MLIRNSESAWVQEMNHFLHHALLASHEDIHRPMLQASPGPQRVDWGVWVSHNQAAVRWVKGRLPEKHLIQEDQVLSSVCHRACSTIFWARSVCISRAATPKLALSTKLKSMVNIAGLALIISSVKIWGSRQSKEQRPGWPKGFALHRTGSPRRVVHTEPSLTSTTFLKSKVKLPTKQSFQLVVLPKLRHLKNSSYYISQATTGAAKQQLSDRCAVLVANLKLVWPDKDRGPKTWKHGERTWSKSCHHDSVENFRFIDFPYIFQLNAA